MRLYENGFSPFSRKVRLALEYKGIECEYVDGLLRESREALARLNGRIEIPLLEHDGVLVVGSADIVAYLERLHPEPALYPRDHARWVRARAWERCADTTIDPILINLSYWQWAERDDQRPEGWLEAARQDMERVYAALERDLADGPFVCGELSIAEFALFPHLVAARSQGVGHAVAAHPRIESWLKRLRERPLCVADIARTRAFLSAFIRGGNHERRKIFYRGERMEWLLAHGFHGWLLEEIEADRVLWPGLGIPTA